MMNRFLAVTAAAAAGWWSGAIAAEAGLQPVTAGTRAAVPRWAKAELQARESTRRAFHTFVDRFIKPDGSTCVTDFGGGNLDDINEGFMGWDRFLAVEGDEKTRKAYVAVCKYYWDYAAKKRWFVNGFYRHGYDYEHGGEMFPHLWGAVEIAPKDEKLLALNRAFADLLADPRVHNPGTGFLRAGYLTGEKLTDYHGHTRGGDCVGNTQYAAGPFLAYLASGDEKYRRWLLDYTGAWAGATKANGGVIPYYVDSAAGKPAKEWWTAPRSSHRYGDALRQFSYGEYWGTLIAQRGFFVWFTTAALLTGGDGKQVDPLVGFLEVLMEKGEGARPATHYVPGTGWIHYSKTKAPKYSEGSFDSLLEVAHQLTHSARTAKLFERRWAARPGNLRRARFHLFGELSEDDAAGFFEYIARKNGTFRDRMLKVPADKLPRTGDELRVHTPRVSMYAWIDGGTAKAYGDANMAPVRYFGEDGSAGLPVEVAALVKRIGKDRLRLLLFNSAAEPRRVMLTAGYYGQDRFESVASGGASAKISGRRVLIEVRPGSLAELDFKVRRFAFHPTLSPQASDGEPFKPVGE